MALYRRKNTKNWSYEFVKNGVRHRATTGTSVRADALRIELEAQVAAEKSYRRRNITSLARVAGLDVQRATDHGATATHIETCLSTHWRHLASFFGTEKDMASFTADDVADYVRHRREAGVRAQTINRELGTFKRAFRLAELPTPFPWPLLKKSSPHEGLAGKAHPIATLTKWLAILPPDARDMAEVALLTGMRREELRRMESSWLRNDEVLVLPAAGTKTRRERILGVSAQLLVILKKLFARSHQPFGGRDHKTAFNTASARLGIVPHITLRDLRHCHATFALRATQDVTGVMKAMGHSTIATASLYQHTDITRAKAVANVLPDLLDLNSNG